MNDQWIMFCYGAGAGAGVSFVALAWLFHILGERKRQRRVRATTERPFEDAFTIRARTRQVDPSAPARGPRRPIGEISIVLSHPSRRYVPPKGPPLRTPPPPPPRTPPSQEDMRQ